MYLYGSATSVIFGNFRQVNRSVSLLVSLFFLLTIVVPILSTLRPEWGLDLAENSRLNLLGQPLNFKIKKSL